jgi:SAM-dependent methyltransferase
MAEFKDHFSKQSTGYSRYRPNYPEELFAFLASLCRQPVKAWDCGCGTGQAAHGLVRHFKSVVATDASEAQIEKAAAGDGITYRVATAEASGLDDDSVDLVLVAQALHWFDFDMFYREVRRVCRPGGVLVAIAYGLMRINPEIDRVIDRLYVDLLGDDWPPERKHIDNAYETIPFPFAPLPGKGFAMLAEWSFDHCLGYLKTWSAVQNYREREENCPVSLVADEILDAWGDREQVLHVSWPLHLLLGKV